MATVSNGDLIRAVSDDALGGAEVVFRASYDELLDTVCKLVTEAESRGAEIASAQPAPGEAMGPEVRAMVESCLRVLEDPAMHNAGKGQAVLELANRLRGLQPNVWTAAPNSVSPALAFHKCRECGNTFTWVTYDETRCLDCCEKEEAASAVAEPDEIAIDALLAANQALAAARDAAESRAEELKAQLAEAQGKLAARDEERAALLGIIARREPRKHRGVPQGETGLLCGHSDCWCYQDPDVRLAVQHSARPTKPNPAGERGAFRVGQRVIWVGRAEDEGTVCQIKRIDVNGTAQLIPLEMTGERWQYTALLTNLRPMVDPAPPQPSAVDSLRAELIAGLRFADDNWGSCEGHSGKTFARTLADLLERGGQK